MPLFEKHHKDEILADFESRLKELGFTRKRKDLFVRDAQDGLVHAVNVSLQSHTINLHIEPIFRIMHAEAGKLAQAAIFHGKPVPKDSLQREACATLLQGPVSFLLAQKMGPGTGKADRSKYTIFDPSERKEAVRLIMNDLKSLHDDFFQKACNLDDMLDLLEKGNQHAVYMSGVLAQRMALYSLTGREADLKSLASDIQSGNAAPMIKTASAHFLEKLGEKTELPTAQEAPSSLPKMTREESKRYTAHKKAFVAATRQAAKGSGWKQANSAIFRQYDDWFVHCIPVALPEGGLSLQWGVKPFAADPLFWDIIGSEQDLKQPLSFRVFGVSALKAKPVRQVLARDVTDPDKLAVALFDWAAKLVSDQISTMTLESYLSQMGPLEQLHRDERILAVCTLILLDRLTEARELADYSGNGSLILNGQESFFGLARDWIAQKCRSGLKLL